MPSFWACLAQVVVILPTRNNMFSGKTTTIVCIIRLLVQQGKTILLTSYTHTAVDNVLLKLEESGIDFTRLGRAENIHPLLKKYSFDVTPANSVKEFEGSVAKR